MKDQLPVLLVGMYMYFLDKISVIAEYNENTDRAWTVQFIEIIDHIEILTHSYSAISVIPCLHITI